MTWNWYLIKSVDEAMSGDVPDETLTVDLGAGDETIRIIRGFSVGIIFRGYSLFPNMNDRNPFTKDDAVGAYIKDGNYYVGVNNND